jgi:hypothetical protein
MLVFMAMIRSTIIFIVTPPILVSASASMIYSVTLSIDAPYSTA